MAEPQDPHSTHDPLQALRYRDYRFYAMAGICAMLAYQMQSVAIGWELYERTHSAMMLGWVGLVQFLPFFLLALPGGQLADRYDRRTIVLLSQLVQILCSACLAWLSSVHGPVEAYLAILGLSAAAHAFQVPAASALLPQVVPDKVLANASVWNSSVMHISMVLGPAVGGFQIALQHQASGVYVVDACLNVLYFFLIYAIASRQTTKSTEPVTLKGLLAGMQFIWQSKIILAALTLDLFAVLLGGATMLLPVFTRDILHVGPEGLGWLRAAPSLGALLMALALAYMPPMRNVGRLLIAVVAGFGLSMIGFGLSQVFWVSLVFLFLSGALDNVSVVIRASLLQLRTPDAVRGRVLAVNSVFISSSNELGGFESGLTASLFGPVASVVGGGIGTILVVFAVARAWPELRALDRLEPVQPSISAAGEEMLPQTQEL